MALHQEFKGPPPQTGELKQLRIEIRQAVSVPKTPPRTTNTVSSPGSQDAGTGFRALAIAGHLSMKENGSVLVTLAIRVVPESLEGWTTHPCRSLLHKEEPF